MQNVRRHKSGRFEARMTIQGRAWSAYGSTEAEAVEELRKKFESQKLPESPSFILWMEERYLPSIQRTTPRHQEKAKWAISKLGRLGPRPLSELTRHELQLAIDALSKKHAAETVKTIRSIWMAGLTLAEADDLIAKNPMRFVKVKSAPPKAKDVLSGPELLKLIEHSRGYAPHASIVLAGLLGLRIGEIARLRPEHFKESGKLIVPGTKSAASVRELPLHPRILLEIASCTFPLTKGKDRAGEAMRRAAYRAQIETSIHPHLLRHTFASLLEWIGAPLDVRSRLLGHGKRHVTERYSHFQWRIWSDWLERLVEFVYDGRLPEIVGYTVGQSAPKSPENGQK